MKLKTRKGFTLVELLVVVAILAILASVSVVSMMGFMEKAHRSNDEQLVSNINSVLFADEIFADSHVAPLDIRKNLEEKGFNLKTESKDVDLFYNVNTGKVELGTIENGNYICSFPENTNNSSSKVTNNLLYLERIVDDRILIGTSSKTGISNAIYGIRSANSPE